MLDNNMRTDLMPWAKTQVSPKLSTVLKIEVGDYQTEKKGGENDRYEIILHCSPHAVYTHQPPCGS